MAMPLLIQGVCFEEAVERSHGWFSESDCQEDRDGSGETPDHVAEHHHHPVEAFRITLLCVGVSSVDEDEVQEAVQDI